MIDFTSICVKAFNNYLKFWSNRQKWRYFVP